jgi:hypothetical protein
MKFTKLFTKIGLLFLFIGIICISLPLTGIHRYAAAQSSIPAFPGAEGFGSNTVGGRGGEIYEVTTLNDSGTGSLRACIEATGPRICIFKIGGVIKSSLTISNPYITIAGQTAPGGGITLKSSAGLTIKTHDVVIRYITSRSTPGVQNHGMTAYYNNVPLYNIVIDHCSMSWGTDEVFDFWYDIHNSTVSWSLMSEGLDCNMHDKGCHSKGAEIGGWEGCEGCGTGGGYDISFHHNLMAHNAERSPLLENSGLSDIVNNVSYDTRWEHSTITSVDPNAILKGNYVKNYFKNGPSGGSYEIAPILVGGAGAEYYIEGNIGPHRTSNSQAEDLVLDANKTIAAPNTTGSPQLHRVSARFSAPAVTEYPAYDLTQNVDAYRIVKDSSGNSQGIDSMGNWYKRRDAVDKRIIEEVNRGEGKIIDAPGTSTCVGACRGGSYVLSASDYTKYGITDSLDADGWPVIAGGTPYTDSDHDGMSDAWETAYRFNPNNAADGNQDADGDGYTNVEEFLNGTNPNSNTPSPTPGSASLTPTPIPNRTPTPSPARTPTPNATPSVKTGDANGDGKIDEADYGIWLAHFGQTVTGGKTVGDFDGNGAVDGVDYVIWLSNYGI